MLPQVIANYELEKRKLALREKELELEKMRYRETPYQSNYMPSTNHQNNGYSNPSNY